MLNEDTVNPYLLFNCEVVAIQIVPIGEALELLEKENYVAIDVIPADFTQCEKMVLVKLAPDQSNARANTLMHRACIAIEDMVAELERNWFIVPVTIALSIAAIATMLITTILAK